MPKLPTISYKELLKLLNQLDYQVDYQVDRQRGSHIRMKKILPKGTPLYNHTCAQRDCQGHP